MTSNTVFGWMGFITFLTLYFWGSQKLYQAKYLFLLLLLALFSVSTILGFSFFAYKKHEIKTSFLLLSLCFYLVLITGIKVFYKKINNFLLRKKLLKTKFANKEFTFTFFFATRLVWDTKRVAPPSWFDFLVSMCLLVIPLLLVVLLGGTIE